MRFGIFDKFGAKNSGPVFSAFCQGLDRLGLCYSSHDRNADVAVIWSQVWAGNMQANRDVWSEYRSSYRPVIVLEVGMLQRGQTWKVGVNGTGSNAYWGQGLDSDRPKKLGITLRPWRQQGANIVIACQRQDSEQWRDQPAMAHWLQNTVDQVRQHSSRPIVIRPHPRQKTALPHGTIQVVAKKLPGTYDDYDFFQALDTAWCVINWNSGPGSQAVMAGVPAFVGSSSLAAPVANLDLSQIEQPQRPDRHDWLIDLCHTEWTVRELMSGYPITRLLSGL